MSRIEGFTKADNTYPIGFHLFKNGDLLVNYQARNTFPFGVGLAKFDKDSNLLCKKEGVSHHWFSIDEKGFIYVPTLDILDSPIYLGGTQVNIAC